MGEKDFRDAIRINSEQINQMRYNSWDLIMRDRLIQKMDAQINEINSKADKTEEDERFISQIEDRKTKLISLLENFRHDRDRLTDLERTGGVAQKEQTEEARQNDIKIRDELYDFFDEIYDSQTDRDAKMHVLEVQVTIYSLFDNFDEKIRQMEVGRQTPSKESEEQER